MKAVQVGPCDVAEVIQELVAREKGVDIVDLSPLSDAINPENLGGLFATNSETTGQVKFLYEDCTVIYMSDGRLVVTLRDDATL